MKALLENGSIVELHKDCECKTHGDIPHWVHMDNIDKENSQSLCNSKNFYGYAMVEKVRLREKLYNMQKYHIKELLH